jgi:hypothetical protein
MSFACCIAAGAALASSACGGDGGGGDLEAFCEQIEILAEPGTDTTEAENLAALRAVSAVAPSEVSDQMNELVRVFEQVQSFDPETATENEMIDFLSLADGVEQAGADVEAYAIENCPGLPAGIFSTG